MVRFSCFSTPPAGRSKKVAKRPIGTLQTDYQSATQDHSIKLPKGSGKSNPENYNSSCNSVKRSTSPYSLRDCWRLDGLNVKVSEDNQEILQTVLIKKSHSIGRIMEKESGYSGDDFTEDDDIDREFSFDSLNGWNLKEIPESSDNDNANSTEIFHHENDRKNYQIQKENDLIKAFNILKDPMHHDSLFSIEVLKQPDRDLCVDAAEQAVEDVADTECSSGHIHTLSRSYSVANLRVVATESSKNGSSHGHIFHRSRSFSDPKNFNILETELQNGEKYVDSSGNVEKNIIVSRSNLPLQHDFNRKVPCHNDTEEESLRLVRRKTIKFRDCDGKCLSLKLDMDDKAACNSPCNVNFTDALRKSEANDAKITRECQQHSSMYNWDQLTPQELNMRRVENWISQVDIHGDLIVEEQGESSTTTVSKEESQILAAVDTPKLDTRSNLAMEVAHNYISSMTSSSSSAQMANLGLVAIPVLSPFVSLRVLNLSGNALVHITSGCLPKGLHMLNLSKNNISTIEGLRDLSRLRVLDLNYNRIARIGHGLSFCTSLKELYLAGNKISEVEGLHRLLKLNILDLRFNKISTSKGLGQLAANYVSLQAINLEGNPAQKNVGDEQLKNFLLGLLPNLVYYNKQAIRMGSKEASDHASRAVASPQFDKGFRVKHKLSRNGSQGSKEASDHASRAVASPQFDKGFRVKRKLSRNGSHGSGLNHLASNHGQQILAIPPPSRKPSKDKHVRLHVPVASSKQSKLRSDTGKKPLGLNTNAAVKRS